ncbi:hypothetical protein dsx2_0105 [Desulfovibrio sp. X2]|uniref:DUF465 domain-containing protein n=1 Tax=Desulfovibrio sp. X2 TaxID=941449 RepID=UPI0003587E9B|nr:DUF465 domain-containing protein [Desulfovibrio sp. X2]EPR42178.1 hypothetical protein dsx2_0105 [Desulfovibrio sp. X2]
MEPQELSLIEKNLAQDAELKALWDLHLDYERRLDRLSKKPYLSPNEELELKELKKKKLAGKTKLQAVLNKYKD